MPKYSAICCYFGKWPSHFNYWLKSCSFNQRIDFYIVSDISVEGYEIPANVHILNKSFKDVQAHISLKFPELQIALDCPYKLCDFKVAYGYIFEDLFRGYDYWGYFDIDTIWGDIHKFIPFNEDLRLVKIFPCGHLSFIRNITPWNRIFELVNRIEGIPCRNNMFGKSVVTWQECFSSSESHYYDEEGGLEPLFSSLDVNQYGGVDFDNLLPPWRFDHFYSINFPEKSRYLVYSFNEGHLFRYYLRKMKVQKEEISYVHFSRRQLITKSNSSCFFSICPNKIIFERNWNFLSIFYYGRKRYLGNWINRLMILLGKY